MKRFFISFFPYVFVMMCMGCSKNSKLILGSCYQPADSTAVYEYKIMDNRQVFFNAQNGEIKDKLSNFVNVPCP